MVQETELEVAIGKIFIDYWYYLELKFPYKVFFFKFQDYFFFVKFNVKENADELQSSSGRRCKFCTDDD